MVSCLCRVMVVCERAGSRSPLGVQVAFVFLFVCVDESRDAATATAATLNLASLSVGSCDRLSGVCVCATLGCLFGDCLT